MKRLFFIIFSIFILLNFVFSQRLDITKLKKSGGAKHIHSPVFRFGFPKSGDVLQRGQKYILKWRKIGKSKENLNYIKIVLVNLKSRREFWISRGLYNRGFLNFTMPVMADDGDYHFLIMPMNRGFVNQSPDFKIGAFDLICNIRNLAKVTLWKNYVLAKKWKGRIEFEIWIINKGTGIFSKIPVIWRLIDKETNLVLLQKEAGFSNIFPNRYYHAKIDELFMKRTKVFPLSARTKRKFDLSKVIVEVEIDPRNTLGEKNEFRKNNIARREVEYEMHIKGRK